MIKRSFIIYVISIVAIIAIVGSGFALFFFGEQSKSEDQGNIDISIEDSPELGTLLINKPDDVSYAIFFNSNSVYLYRSDNITQSTPFELEVTVSNQTKVSDGYKLALMCYMEVSDTDDRGLKYNPGIYSDSIVDYLAPSALKFSGGGVPFEIHDDSDTAKNQIYSCLIDADVIKTLTSASGNSESELVGKYNFSIELMYKNKFLAENATGYIAEAKKNSNVKILFELVLVESSS